MSQREAAAAFDQAVEFQKRGRHAEALALFDILSRSYPQIGLIHVKRGAALGAAKRYDEALESFRSAVALDSNNADAHFGLAATLQAMRRLDEALTEYERTIALEPRHALAFNNKGVVLREFGRMKEAIASYDRAIALMPDCADFHLGKGLCTLLLGDFEDGLRLFEWRLQELQPVAPPPAATSLWRGEDLSGKTLLIQAEQGLGDTIQFCRYAAEAEKRGARVVLQVQDRLTRLMESLGPTITILGARSAAPKCDTRAMLLSMPLMCGAVLNDIPCTVPYLAAEPERIPRWREQLGNQGFRIGIAWQGERRWQGEEKEGDIGRSFPVALYEGISRMAGVRLISLQKNDGVEQLRDLPAGMRVETLAQLDDGDDSFLDAAALMESLDLVITSDTAIAHLAGALGRPVWLALKHVPDWRWLLDRDDTPWYPTMRLFRQTRRDDWDDVFARIEARLHETLSAT